MQQRSKIEQILDENLSKEAKEDIIVKTFYEIMLDLRDLQQETNELLRVISTRQDTR